MLVTLLPFVAGTVALLRAWVEWRTTPRGAGGLLFQYGALAAWNWGLLVTEVEGGFPLGLAAGAVGLLWLGPQFLHAFAEHQLRRGATQTLRWLLALRFLLAWHRRHLLDVLYLPVRLLRISGQAEAAVELARRLQGSAWLRGLEPDQADQLASALLAARRYAEIAQDPGLVTAADVHGPVALALAVARAETGDGVGAAEALHRAATLRAPPLLLHLYWARVLAAAGQANELARWLSVSGLADHPVAAPQLGPLRARAAEATRVPSGTLPGPPYEQLVEQRLDAELARRLDTGGPATRLAVWLVMAVYAAEWLAGAETDLGLLAEWGAVVPPLLREGQWWRAVAASLLHGGLLHLFFNVTALAVIGNRVEALVGARLWILVWVVSAAGGTIGSCLGDAPLSVGASGAILGLLGCFVMLLLRRPAGMPDESRRRQLGPMLLAAGVTLAYGLFERMVDNGGHLGGLAAGALCGLVVPPARLRSAPPGIGWLAAGAAAGAAALLSVAAAMISALGGGALDPRTVSTRVVELPDRTRLAIPAWWTIEDGAVLRDAPRNVSLVLQAGAAPPDPAEWVDVDVRGLGAGRLEPPLILPERELPSGVRRRDADARVRLSAGGGELRLRWSFYVTQRGDRLVWGRALGPPGWLRLYGPVLDDLVAQATP